LTKCFRKWKHSGRLPDLAGRKFGTRPHWKGPHLGGGFSLPKSCPFDVFGKCSKSIPPNGPTAQCLGQFFSSKNKVFYKKASKKCFPKKPFFKNRFFSARNK
jgi:hypothetical protein